MSGLTFATGVANDTTDDTAIDPAIADAYRITRFGNCGVMVEWFGRSVAFNSHPSQAANWRDAVAWVTSVHDWLATAPRITLRGGAA